MGKIKKKDLDQKIYDLYDDYAHNKMDRKEFIEKLSLYAVGGLTVSSLLSFVLPNYKDHIQVPENEEKLDTEFIVYDSPNGGGKIRAQLSRIKNKTRKLPGVIVVHENRGLNPHIADVGRRGAMEGFITISPDALTPLGGYPGNDDDGRALQRKRDHNEMLEDFIAAFEYLKNHDECNGNIGVVGFCFGGWISNMMAVKVNGLKAAVPFYGGQPPSELVQNINAALLLHYAELDSRVNAGWPAYETALKKYHKEYTAYIYPNTNHGFHNDSTPRYDDDAAKLAWNRTVNFFTKKLQ